MKCSCWHTALSHLRTGGGDARSAHSQRGMHMIAQVRGHATHGAVDILHEEVLPMEGQEADATIDRRNRPFFVAVAAFREAQIPITLNRWLV